MAGEHGLESVTAIALAYVMAKAPHVFPIVGGRKVEHLKDNMKSLEIKLTDKQIEYLESIVPFEPGFPNNFVGECRHLLLFAALADYESIGEDPHITGKSGMIVAGSANIDYVLSGKPIGHE